MKKNQVLSGESRVISTEYDIRKKEESNVTDQDKQRYISSYENIAKSIVEEARRNGEKIRYQAIKEAEILEKEAYERGYEQGLNNGYEDGKKEAIESIIPQAQEEAEEMKARAHNILQGATQDYNDYMENKKADIIQLAMAISEKILKREVLMGDGINEIIEEAFEMAKGEENIIIRCNGEHEENIKEKIVLWKTTYNISGEIFVLTSDEIEPGNAIIEKSTGKIEIGIDFGLESIKKAIIV
ncbi:FliH/SctL family protein [Clostridium sp. SHJSY1]|uniref:FliH/SctL family protein n=1 Tax=Clostridium sp. SHJSY1 TaxID=2942483 RepID=UPI00287BAABB|nr:FliH/SctL family protein [Clostridium sp. SHJSY1]